MSKEVSITSSLEIRLLGPFRVVVEGRAVEDRLWSRRKPALLVKLLALEPHHQLHREQVMEILWPDLDTEAATNNFHKVIHQARRALEPDLKSVADSHFILTQGQQVSLRAPAKLWVDVKQFEQYAAAALRSTEVEAYEEALSIYGGDLLVEDLYEEWAAMRREQLRAQYLQLLSNLASLYERRGEHPRSIERLIELLACDSTNEEAHRELMRLYAVTGSRQQALRQYQLCCEALRKGLDAEPDRATREMHEQVISGLLAPRPSSQVRAETTAAAIDSLAILPLVNTSDDPEAEYFSDGITESIINSLSQLPQLRVMARSTVFRYKGDDLDPQEVAKRLGVRAVLTGRVFHREDRLNIQTELVDAMDGSQLWGEQYNRNSSDIFEVQEEIAREIAEKLRLKLSGEQKGRLARRYTEDTEAYHAYLKGRFFWNKRSGEGLEKGIEYFKQAIEKDPNCAAAYAGISDCYTILVGRHGLPAEEGLARAKAAAMKALEIDETLAEAHTALGHAMLHNWEWAEAEREFERALELNAGDPVTHQTYYEYLASVGRMEEALAEIMKAQEIDPLSLPINSNVAGAFYYARQYDRSIEQWRKVFEMDPHYYWAHYGLARAYEEKGMFDDAIAELVKAVEVSQGNLHVLAELGRAYAEAGRRDEAMNVIDRLMVEGHRASPYNIAVIYVGLGENDRAFQWLEKAYRERDAVMTHLKLTPRLDSLRSDPRFQNLLRRVGLAPESDP